jgi:hypothetical protein
MTVVRSLAAAVMLMVTLATTLVAPPAQASGWPPCPTEDSVGCVWDAQRQGNGLGVSFIAYPDGHVRYL